MLNVRHARVVREEKLTSTARTRGDILPQHEWLWLWLYAKHRAGTNSCGTLVKAS